MKKLFILGCFSLFILSAQAQISDVRISKSLDKSKTKVAPKDVPYSCGFEDGEKFLDDWWFENWYYCWDSVWTDPNPALWPDCSKQGYMWIDYSNSDFGQNMAYEGTKVLGILGKSSESNPEDFMLSPYFRITQTGTHEISFKSLFFSNSDSLFVLLYKLNPATEKLDLIDVKEIFSINHMNWDIYGFIKDFTVGDIVSVVIIAANTPQEDLPLQGILIDDFRVFSYNTYTVNSNNNLWGTVSSTPNSGTHPTGTSITATATPESGYKFVNWTMNGNPAGNANPYTFNLTQNVTLVANFGLINGIQESELSTISIYPNPITDVLTVSVERSYDITVSDVSGRVVLQQKLNSENSIIDFSNYQSGAYFIQFRNAEEVKTIKVFKVQ